MTSWWPVREIWSRLRLLVDSIWLIVANRVPLTGRGLPRTTYRPWTYRAALTGGRRTVSGCFSCDLVRWRPVRGIWPRLHLARSGFVCWLPFIWLLGSAPHPERTLSHTYLEVLIPSTCLEVLIPDIYLEVLIPGANFGANVEIAFSGRGGIPHRR